MWPDEYKCVLMKQERRTTTSIAREAQPGSERNDRSFSSKYLTLQEVDIQDSKTESLGKLSPSFKENSTTRLQLQGYRLHPRFRKTKAGNPVKNRDERRK